MNESNPAPWLVVGAGAWGSALALKLAQTGVPVRLWARDAAAVAALHASGENVPYLPGIHFPACVRTYSELEVAAHGVSNVLIATPTAAFGAMLSVLAEHSGECR